MKIAIIGCGYVGKAIADFWTKQGHCVTVTTTTPEKLTTLEGITQKVMLVRGENWQELDKAVDGQDVVLLSVGAKNRNAYRQTYLETAKNLVKALENKTQVKQLIYTGSYAVLGDKQGEWVDETAPAAPANENGEILVETERILLSAQTDNRKVCIVRLAGIYGAGREIINIFRSWAGTTRPGTGKDYTNWIHLDDIVGALELIREKELEGIYHLANDQPMTTQEFYDHLFKTHGLPSITWDPSMGSIRPYNARLSNEKIKSAGLKLIHPETLF